MATTTVTFTGTSEWAKVYAGQIDREFVDDTNPRDKGGNWSIGVILDEDEMKTFRAIGTKAGPDKKNPNKVTFRRYEKSFLGPLSPPEVVLPDGYEDGTSIGNGSAVEVEVDIYDYTFKNKPGKAMRLKKVTVTKLVEYKKPDGDAPKLADPVPF